jgi:hypothetical protein
MHCIEGAIVLYLLFFLHSTCGDYNTCGVGLNTPGGEYGWTLSKLVYNACVFIQRGCTFTSDISHLVCDCVVLFISWIGFHV